jgi:hypothetical protein
VSFSGSLRSPHEADALTVNVGLQAGEITMHAADTELGRWPATAVEIRRFGKTAFEFTAEGDRLIFTPDDPVTFGGSPIVVRRDAGPDNQKRRRSKKRSKEDKPQLVVDGNLLEERRAAREAKQESANGRAKRRSRRRRKVAKELAGSEHDDLDIASVAPPDAPKPNDTTVDEAHQPADVASSSGRKKRSSPEDGDARSTDRKQRFHGAWILAIDLARKYDAFGLDRVPIDTSLRGGDHQHTWDHRVAATSGLGQHICTICGAIKR